MELYSADISTVAIGGAQVPLEIDLTTYRAYNLNQSTIWKLGPLQFLAPAERFPSQLIMMQPYDPNRIPLVLVHGTFSSPVTWAEMGNTLTADPRLLQKYQIWAFMYGSGNPLIFSIGDLRKMLTAKVAELDPAGTNAMLQQMVVIGHSQGGLLTKTTAMDTGDQLWSMFTTNRLEDLKVSDEKRDELRRLMFIKPLPFVKRVVFISTPHRGSYLAGGFVRNLAHRFVSLPGAVLSTETQMLTLTEGSQFGAFIHGKMTTSLDGMSPKNPALLAMAEVPVVPSVTAHSIVSIDGDDQPPKGGDGIVKYTSAHVDYVESEFIVRSFHTCLDHPATIEEVRRILYLHLDELKK
ncbi:MAG: hypothetical protein HC814_00930 [Rhodobacteraceae bacterium]|nr:hypothetical protein [Paracoccaceae bacterium]